MPTINYGVTCGISMPPYIGKCNYNGAFEALNVLFDGKLKKGSGKYNKANLYSVPQNGSTISMGPNAYVYAPTKCKESDAKCPVHIVFHGCKQSINDIQMQYVENTGYNEIAEDNNFVILYPQAIATSSSNPNGCWDWWGYLNADYANQSGPQINEVNRLISELKNGSIELTSVEMESKLQISELLTPQ